MSVSIKLIMIFLHIRDTILFFHDLCFLILFVSSSFCFIYLKEETINLSGKI